MRSSGFYIFIDLIKIKILSQGYDCNPMMFAFDGNKITLSGKLDQPQEKESGTMR